MPLSRRFCCNALVAMGLGALSLAALAQVPWRTFPPGTQYATLRMGAYPQATLNKNPTTLSPGLRVFTQQNIIILYNQIPTTPVDVAYKMDTQGYVQSLWILTHSEVASVKSQGTGTWPFGTRFFQ